LTLLFLKKRIKNEVPSIVSMVMAVSIVVLTVPLISSKLPMQAKPIIVIPVARLMLCLAFEGCRFMDPSINTEIPSINMDVLRQRIDTVSEGYNPSPVTKASEFINSWKNK
jgi:hypothetical protein